MVRGSHSLDGPLVDAVIQGLKQANKIVKYVPVFLNQDGHKDDHKHVVKKISSYMRANLTEPVRYVMLLVLLQLVEFATEAIQAFEESRAIMLPEPKNDVDYTVLRIWRRFNSSTLEEYEEHGDWKGVAWNPYKSLQHGLESLTKYIGAKQFGLDATEEEEEAPAPKKTETKKKAKKSK